MGNDRTDHRKRGEALFTHKCPSCQGNYKVIKKCRKCLVYVCSQCSIDSFCIDCFTTQRADEERDRYFHDKLYDHKMGVMV